jgi:hypothetical protein
MDQRAGENVLYVDKKRQRQYDGEELMEENDSAESAYPAGKFSGPEALAEAHGKARGRQSKKRGEQDSMKVSLLSREAHEIPLCRMALRSVIICRLLQISHSFLP